MVLFVTIIILVLPFHYFVDKGHMFFVVFIQLLLILLYMLFQLSYVGFGFLQGLRIRQVRLPLLLFTQKFTHQLTELYQLCAFLFHIRRAGKSWFTRFIINVNVVLFQKSPGGRHLVFNRLSGFEAVSFYLFKYIFRYGDFARFHMRYLLHYSWITQK